MTSNGSSSTADQPPPPARNFSELVQDPQLWAKVRQLLGTSQWEALVLLLQTERLRHLEWLAANITTEQLIEHRAIANWINYFFSKDFEEELRAEHDSESRAPKAVETYMQTDSDDKFDFTEET